MGWLTRRVTVPRWIIFGLSLTQIMLTALLMVDHPHHAKVFEWIAFVSAPAAIFVALYGLAEL